jgi:cytoskeleton protein RodZ
MQPLGETLREAREARALTLEEVAHETRIRVRYLRALEEDDFSLFPSSIHAKGFLRNYAQFLGMDAESLVAQYGEIVGELAPSMTVGTAFQAPPPGPAPAIQAPRAAIKQPTQRPGSATPAGPAIPPESPLPELEQPASPAGQIFRSNWFTAAVLGAGLIVVVVWVIVRLSSVSFANSADESASVFLEELSALETVTPSPTFQPTSTSGPQAGPDFFDRVVLTIRVEQRSWTRVVVDGAVAFEGQASPDTVLQYEGSQSIGIVAGNGAGLDVTYNGQEIGPLGGRGEVVEWLFTVEGEMTPTPTPTVTTTSTSVPTATPTRTPRP